MPQFMAMDPEGSNQVDKGPLGWFIHGSDPASLCGIDLNLPPKSHQGWIFYHQDQVLASSSKNLKTLDCTLASLGKLDLLADLLFQCSRLLLDRDFAAPGSIQLQTIDGNPARNHGLGTLLQARGFKVDGNSLRLWKY